MMNEKTTLQMNHQIIYQTIHKTMHKIMGASYESN